MNIEAIIEAATHEAAQQLTGGPLPPAAWPWSQQVIDALEAYDTATTLHTERWSALQDAISDYQEANAADQVARRRAAREGKKDPGISATESAARAVEYATFGCNEARRAANNAWPGDLIRHEVETRQVDFARALVARIREATTRYNMKLGEAQAIMAAATRPLDALRAELVWANGKFDGIRFGTVQQGYEDVVWPRHADQWSERWILLLRHLTDPPAPSVHTQFETDQTAGTLT